MDTRSSLQAAHLPDRDFRDQVAALSVTESVAHRLAELGTRFGLWSIDRGPSSLNLNFRVTDETGRKYFVKFIGDAQRMQNELLIHRLKHHFRSFELPQLVDSSSEHLVCEFVTGTSLRDLIRSDPERSLVYVAAVVEELDANAAVIGTHLSRGWRSSNPLGRALRQVHTPLVQESPVYPLVAHFLAVLDERQCAIDEMVTGDFRLDHMLVDHNDRCFVIDWEWMQLADRNLDYATLFNQAFKHNREAALSLYQFLSQRPAFRQANFLLFAVSGMLFYIADYTKKDSLPEARRWRSCLEALVTNFAQNFSAPPAAPAPVVEQNERWQALENKYRLNGIPFRTEADPCERVYVLDQEIWKIRAAANDLPRRGVPPKMEADCLRKLAAVSGTCRLKRFINETDHTILILERFHHVGTLATVHLPAEVQDRVDHTWRRILRDVNDAGVLHNDARPAKFLVNADHDLCLVGYTHAERRRSSDFLAGSLYRPPRAPVQRVGLLGEAWDFALRWKAKGGKDYSYNSLTIDDVHFPGDRPWEERWSLLGPALRAACGGSLAGKRILELGCNIGLLSVWAAREGATCHGYEAKDYLVKAATRVARAFAVEERCHFRKCDLNDMTAIAAAAEAYDICTVLSVLVWIKDPTSLISFLSRQSAVLYEGHDTPEQAALRLEQCGFRRVRVIGISERQRFLFLATR